MNLEFGMCPRCKMDIAEDRLREPLVVCQHCGFSDPKSDRKLEKKIYSHFLRTSLIVTGLLLAGFIQAVNWDQYSLSIIPLKVKELSGIANLQDYQQLSKICEERKKWDCVETSLRQRYTLSPRTEIEALAQLGKLQYKRGKLAESLQSLKTYFDQGGISLDASYDYARALSQRGFVDQASQVYEQILEAKPETLQITVAQNYVRLLMKNNKYREAKTLLEDIRKSGSNANLFMDKEFQELETYVK